MDNNGAEVLLQNRRGATQRALAPDIRRSRGVYVTRLILRYLSLFTSCAIIAVLVDAIRSYKKTQHVTNPFKDGNGRFPVWPETLKLAPTYALLGVAVLAASTSLILCLASFSSAVRRMTKTGNFWTGIISFICLVFWVVVTALYGTWDTKETNFDLLSWTCKHSTPEYEYNNIDFAETCTEMRFAFWAAVGLAGLEFVNLVMFLIWYSRSNKSRGYAKMGGEEEGLTAKPDQSDNSGRINRIAGWAAMQVST
ncbi:hypothetical protein B0J11DRAFT_547171 [Dendryphion nanum]|uniref:MARVEL domain-containing protein n=1 Tax=Dendryphion nanum TaxID=256645 RepID=A0A9P9ECV4_9PLEO|nr:hypothetical protein B0J11DRAFT_547171 [Dendryphion nanum]